MHTSFSTTHMLTQSIQLAKVLSKASSSHPVAFAPTYAMPSGGYSPNNNSPPLMMRKPVSCARSARRAP